VVRFTLQPFCPQYPLVGIQYGKYTKNLIKTLKFETVPLYVSEIINKRIPQCHFLCGCKKGKDLGVHMYSLQFFNILFELNFDT
jgi:hypothetical protein